MSDEHSTVAAKPTPGPWHINERHSKIEIIPVRPERGFHGQYIEIAVVPFPRTGAKRGQPVRYLPTPQHQANARLIAAAPDLLEALERAVTYIELTYDEEAGEEAAEAKHDLDKARAAIKRATEG